MKNRQDGSFLKSLYSRGETDMDQLITQRHESLPAGVSLLKK